jgi:hypothetical protein
MDFLKKHYEKLILSIVLLGLAGAVAALPMKVGQEKEKEEQRKQALIGAPVKPFAPVDLSTNKAVLEKVKNPIKFEISGKHNLFNPVPWEKRPNGELVKLKVGNETGIDALKVVQTRPLQMIIKLDDVSTSDTNNIKYTITVIRETDKQPKNARALAKGAPSNIGSIKDVIGPPDAPTALIFRLPDGREVTVSKDKPYTEIIGYSADLLYPYTNWSKKDARKDDVLPPLGNDTYKIVAIEKDEVVFSAKSNQKQTHKKVGDDAK